MNASDKVVAVVNDDTTFLSLMHELLVEEGYTAVILREADAAYMEIRARLPDLVILDIRMSHPESGWTILDLMRLDRATARIPVIVCSADLPTLRAKEEYLRSKGCDVLPKPFDIDDLLDKVNEAVGPPGERRRG